MIRKIALIHPPYISNIKSVPLGLAYISAFLKKHGYAVQLIDMDPMGMDIERLKDKLIQFCPDAVGISFMTLQAEQAHKIASEVKEISNKIVTVAGGIHASSLPKDTLMNSDFDFVVVGEGEETFREMLEFLNKGENSYSSIKGLAFKKDGQIQINERRKLIANVDLLPFPDRSNLPIHKYTNSILGKEDNSPVFSILSTRGCPYSCVFCASHIIFKRKYRARSVENIFSEIKFLMKRYDARNFDFVDDTLTVDKKRLSDLCDLIIEEGSDISWLCNARVDGFDESIAYKLKAAGCKIVCFGVESGDPNVWKAINKKLNREDILTVHRAAKKAGLTVVSFFMVGNLGESKDSIDKTVQFINEIDSDYPTCSIATPYPGTKMFELGLKHCMIDSYDWSHYITTPHARMDYKPFWRNEFMDAKEILEAYYYVNSKIIKKKLRTRYGLKYYLNPKFYKKEIMERVRNRGVREIVKLTYKLLRVS